MKQQRKKALKLALATAFFGLAANQMDAQQTMVASGNNATGSGGSISYSVGQMIHVNNSSEDGSAIQGIQFAFDDANLSIIDLQTNFEITTYPNPTTSILNVNINGIEEAPMDYQLFNTSGQIVRKGRVNGSSTKILVNDLPTASYILKIQNNQTTKSFKIIKN
ncbi:T9SS type A sorting domain-containing protein [Tamlana crocina]